MGRSGRTIRQRAAASAIFATASSACLRRYASTASRPAYHFAVYKNPLTT